MKDCFSGTIIIMLVLLSFYPASENLFLLLGNADRRGTDCLLLFMKVYRSRLFKIIFFHTNALIAHYNLSSKMEIQFPRFMKSSHFQELLFSHCTKACLPAQPCNSAGSS